ncbi:MAG: Hpt domain-containing protein [Methylotetracoccus sp.]
MPHTGRWAFDVPLHSSLRGLRVLVVGGDGAACEAVMRMLRAKGVATTHAGNVEAALEHLAATSTVGDIVLLKIESADADEFRAVQRIRADARGRSLRLIALTEREDAVDLSQACQAAGMLGCLSLPLNPDRLLDLLGLGSGLTGSGKKTENAFGSAPSIDLERALATFRDPAVYARLLKRFEEHYRWAADSLGELLAEGDGAGAESLMHRLKGAAGSLALVEVAAVAASLEGQLKAGMGMAPERIGPLRRALADALESIDSFTALQGAAAAPGAVRAASVEAGMGVLLHRLLAALDRDEPGQAEPIIRELSACLPAEKTVALRHAVEDFDFREAERATRRLASALGIALEIEED